jgi:hypothetical protein
MDFAIRPLRSDGLDWCTLDEGGLITDVELGRAWSLNPVGLFIWDHCDGLRDIGQIENALRISFGIDAPTAHGDLQLFLIDMEAEGLIQLAYPPAC